MERNARPHLRTVVFALFTIFALLTTSTAHADRMYGVDGASGNTAASLYVMNQINGDSFFVGQVGFSEVVSIDFNPTTGVLFGVSNRDGNGDFNAELITINTTTGVGSSVASLSGDYVAGDHNISDLSFDPNTGTLYGWLQGLGNPFDMVTIDTTTGVVTTVGDFGAVTFGTGVAVDSNSNIFMKTGKQSPELHTLNATGQSTGSVAFSGFSNRVHNTLEFGSNDTLYAVERLLQNNNFIDSVLYTVDTNTGQMTTVGTTLVSHLAGIAINPNETTFTGPPPPAPVPEPSTMLLFGTGVIGLLGYARRRGRKNTS